MTVGPFLQIDVHFNTNTASVLMIVALIFAVLLSASCFICQNFGLGKHIWNLSPVLTELPAATGRVTKALYGSYLAYSTAIAFTKFSIMATYFRIFDPKGMLRKVVLAIALVVLLFLDLFRLCHHLHLRSGQRSLGLHNRGKVLPDCEILLCQFILQHCDGSAPVFLADVHVMGFEDARG